MTDDEASSLRTALLNAAAGAEISVDVELGPHYRELVRECSASLDDSLLHEVVRALPPDELPSDGLFFTYGGMMGGLGTSRASLARWLVAQTRTHGIDVALDRWRKLIDGVANEYEVLAVSGIEIKEPLDLGGGRSLMSIQALPPSLGKAKLLDDKPTYRFGDSAFGRPVPTAAFVLRRSVPRLLFTADETPGMREPDDLLNELAELLSAYHNVPVLPLVRWFHVDAWIPNADRSAKSVPPATEVFRSLAGHRLVEPGFITLAQRYADLPPAMRIRLRVPIERLALSHLRVRPGDRAIELGTALESLLASDRSRDEPISHLVRTRGALLLERSYLGRWQIYATLRDVYNLRSTAVHEGRIPESITKGRRRGRRTSDVIFDGQRICGRVIQWFIEHGEEPNWSYISLAGPEDYALEDVCDEDDVSGTQDA